METLLTLLTLSLATSYLWGFCHVYLKVPDWLIHFVLLPGTVYGLSYLPDKYLTLLAVCGTVYLLAQLLPFLRQREQLLGNKPVVSQRSLNRSVRRDKYSMPQLP